MKFNSYILAAALLVTTSASAAKMDSFRLGENQKNVLVNNCILCRVNGKVISACDVMKKMDILFYKQYPQYAAFPEARYEFYQVNWKNTLEELIDKELILADAEDNKLPISNGDVRQEMESIFGPNIIQNLDKINLAYTEAAKMIQEEITIRRMVFVRVNQKVLKQITPQDVKVAYEAFAKENVKPAKWTYYVISIRDPDETSGAEAADTVHHLLEDQTPITTLSDKIKEMNLFGPKTVINVSQEHVHTLKEMSDNYKEIVLTLAPGQHSKAIPQNSKSDKSRVYRIFYLKEHDEGGIIPFAEVADRIQDNLLSEGINKESDKYLSKLRKHYDIQDGPLKEMLEQGYQPFALK